MGSRLASLSRRSVEDPPETGAVPVAIIWEDRRRDQGPRKKVALPPGGVNQRDERRRPGPRASPGPGEGGWQIEGGEIVKTASAPSKPSLGRYYRARARRSCAGRRRSRGGRPLAESSRARQASAGRLFRSSGRGDGHRVPVSWPPRPRRRSLTSKTRRAVGTEGRRQQRVDVGARGGDGDRQSQAARPGLFDQRRDAGAQGAGAGAHDLAVDRVLGGMEVAISASESAGASAPSLSNHRRMRSLPPVTFGSSR